MNAATASKQRDHWHRRATELARLDCELVQLLPMTEPPTALGQLRPEAFAALTRRLSELVDWACEQAKAFRSERAIEFALARQIWCFVKTLNPNLEPFGDY